MLLKPTFDDLKLIGHNLGRVLTVTAAAGLLPLIWAIAEHEPAPAAAFLLMVAVYAVLGALGLRLSSRRKHLSWSHGMVVVALVWLLVPAVGAIPFWLSGHFTGYLDAFFDAMSGITTTGLTVANDLDHMASSMIFWRHLLHFLGGQGIIIAALSLFAGAGVAALYHSEGRDEHIFPSVGSTARFIWLVSVVNALLGITVLTIIGTSSLGFEMGRSIFHGITIFMAAFDTGGFSPQSTSIAYYHSALYEAATSILMVAGAISFGLHYALWRRQRDLHRNIEARTLLITFFGTLIITQVGLVTLGLYDTVGPLTRQSYFQVLSAHTGTGFATVPSSELALWGGLAFAGVAVAMALGGMASSTAGGVKALRIGLTAKAIVAQVKRVLLPEGTVISTRFWLNGPKDLSPQVVQGVMTATLLYAALYLIGAGAGLAVGLPLQDAVFESISAAANVGLSVGVTGPGMPTLLKVTYMLQMWAGRLEFLAVFSLFGFFWAMVRGR